MLTFDVSDTLGQAASRLALLSEKNIRYVVARALTDAGKAAQADLKADMPRFIDRPTRWTLGGTYVQFAKTADLTVEVGIRNDSTGGGTPPARYLQPLITGGPPRPKGADLSASKIAGTRGVLIPHTGGMRLDRYGNVSLSNYTAVLSGVRDKTSGLFVGKVTPSGSVKGIFRRSENFLPRSNTVQGRLRLLFVVDPNPKPRTPRFPVQHLLEDSIRKSLPSLLQQGLQEELAKQLGIGS